MILFREKYPRWWFDWNLKLQRFGNRVHAYSALLNDTYPSTDEEQCGPPRLPYPDAKRELNRWLPLVKWFLAIPHYVVLFFLGIARVLLTIAAWFAILFTGRYPRGHLRLHRRRIPVGQPRVGLRLHAGHRSLPAVPPGPLGDQAGACRASAARPGPVGSGSAAPVRSPRVSWRAVRRGVQVLAGVVVAAWLAAAPAAHAVDVTIRRTAHGIPHVYAHDFTSLTYGYAYAFAQDNLCQIADSYVTVGAQRSRFFGPDELVALRGQRGDGQQPQLRLLLPAHQRHEGHREAPGAAAAARARCPRSRTVSAATSPATTPTCATPAWTSSPTRRAAASRGCARSTRWTSTGASTSWPRWPARASRSTESPERRRWPAARRPPAPPSSPPPSPSSPTSAPTPTASAARRPTTAVGWCSATRTSPGRAPSASTRRSSRSRASSTSRAPRCSAFPSS